MWRTLRGCVLEEEFNNTGIKGRKELIGGWEEGFSSIKVGEKAMEWLWNIHYLFSNMYCLGFLNTVVWLELLRLKMYLNVSEM